MHTPVGPGPKFMLVRPIGFGFICAGERGEVTVFLAGEK